MPGGRPSAIDRVVAHVQGRPVTAAQQIVQAVAAGNYMETAAAAAGVHKDTLYEWLKVGAAAHSKQGRLSHHEQACAEFSDAVAEALAQSEATDVTRLAQLAQGGLVVETVTERMNVIQGQNGEQIQVVERTVKSETLAPSLAAVTWRLERRFGKRWGRKTEVTGAEGGPITLDLAANAREAIEGKLDEIAERLALAAPVTPELDPAAEGVTEEPPVTP